MARFAILLHETPGAWDRLPDAERDRLMRLYGTWVGDLRAAGAYVDGWPLAEAARVLTRGPGGIAESAPAADRPAETGLFLVEAEDLDAATRLARGCPALVHGESVVVRAVGQVG